MSPLGLASPVQVLNRAPGLGGFNRGQRCIWPSPPQLRLLAVMILPRQPTVYFHFALADLVPILLVLLVLGFGFLSLLKLSVSQVVIALLQLVYSSYFSEVGKEKEKTKSGENKENNKSGESKGEKSEAINDKSHKSGQDKAKTKSNELYSRDISFTSNGKWISLQVQRQKVHLPSILNGLVSLLLYSVCATSFAVFWDGALIQSKFDNCISGEGFSCFPRNSRLTDAPVNCSSYTEDVVGLICFKFQWDVSKGLADAGGIVNAATLVLVITVTIILTIKTILTWLIVCLGYTKHPDCCCRCSFKKRYFKRIESAVITTMFVFQVIAILISVTAVLLVLGIGPLWNYFRHDYARMMKILCFFLTIFILLCIPWYICYIEDVSEEDKAKQKNGQL